MTYDATCKRITRYCYKENLCEGDGSNDEPEGNGTIDNGYEIDENGTILVVDDCRTHGYPYYIGKKCYDTCPDDYFLITDDLSEEESVECAPDCPWMIIVRKWQPQYCVHSCPVNLFAIGNLCVSECPAGTTVVDGVCVGGNKASQWIYIVIAVGSAFLITLIIMIILLKRKMDVGIQRVKSRLDHSGKTTYYSNSIRNKTQKQQVVKTQPKSGGKFK